MATCAHVMMLHVGMRRNAMSTDGDDMLRARLPTSLWLHENAHDRYSAMVGTFLPHGPKPMSTLNFHTPIGYKNEPNCHCSLGRLLLTSFEVLGGVFQ